MTALVRAPVHPNPALYYSPEMVTDLALGMDPPYDIAARYGLTSQEFDQLQAQAWFGELVARKRQELSDEGLMFPAKAAMMAEELYVQLFRAAMGGTLAHNLVVQVAEKLSDIGQLKPKQAVGPSAGGPAFQINIQVNGVDAQKAKAGDNVQKVEATGPVITIPLEPQIPPKPEGLRVPDFDLRPGSRSALVGSPVAVEAAKSVGSTPERR